MEQPVDLGLVPGLGSFEKLVPIIDVSSFQGREIVFECVLGKVVFAYRLGGSLAVWSDVEAMVPLLTRR
jgi:hypothetical protein